MAATPAVPAAAGVALTNIKKGDQVILLADGGRRGAEVQIVTRDTPTTIYINPHYADVKFRRSDGRKMGTRSAWDTSYTIVPADHPAGMRAVAATLADRERSDLRHRIKDALPGTGIEQLRTIATVLGIEP